MSKIGFNVKSNYFEKTPMFLSKKGMGQGEVKPWIQVLVESDDDKRLWLSIFEKYRGKYKFRYMSALEHESDDGKCSNGCSRLVALHKNGKIELGKHLIFCLDSDYGFVSGNYSCKQKEILNIDHVYQTFVHSKESVYINPHGIDVILSRAIGDDIQSEGVSLVKINADLSVALYPIWVKMIAVYKNGVEKSFDYYHDKFAKILPECFDYKNINEFLLSDLPSIFKGKFEGFDEEISAFIAQEIGPHAIREVVDRLKELNIDSSDCLFFIRGHNLFPIMKKIYEDIEELFFLKKINKIDNLEIPTPQKSQQKKALANKRIQIVDVILSRGDVCDTPFFKNTISVLDKHYA
ncbi:DUF4435 domain-containing protein [Serratia fonticola]|uniref:DUF4435 domain-containing protein n=1 Tax=Serratia fonticola TaxID=47917 RepID=UPI00301D587C